MRILHSRRTQKTVKMKSAPSAIGDVIGVRRAMRGTENMNAAAWRWNGDEFMKLHRNKPIWRAMIGFFSLIIVLSSLGGCSSDQKVLMRVGKTELTVNTYELLLSRMKGTLAYNGYDVDQAEFWDYIWSADGATYEDYFSSEILSAAKDMLLRLYLFDEVYHLTLPQSYLDDIDVYMADILENDFDNSKTKMNSELSKYGVNEKMLRENYIMEDKLDYLATYLSSMTADSAREEYYQNNYVCFRQILFPLYEYQYVTDENGDLVYYRQGTNYIAYDTKNGKTQQATDGTLRKDENGDTMYFWEDGSVAYDTENGDLMGLDADQDGYVDYVELSKEESENVTANAKKLQGLIENGDFSTFEAYGAEYAGDDGVWDAYPNGIFLNNEKSYSLDYLNELSSQLNEANVGDLILYRSDSAYHLVMKYSLEEQAWDDTANSDWFNDFEDELMETVIAALCQDYMNQIEIDEEALATVTGIKEIGANWNY